MKGFLLPAYIKPFRKAIGKKHVLKQYSENMVVITRRPDMSHIIATTKQRECRDLFKEAVAHAKLVMADPLQKSAWQKRIAQKNRVFISIVKEYMLEAKRKEILFQQLPIPASTRLEAAKTMINGCFDQDPDCNNELNKTVNEGKLVLKE